MTRFVESVSVVSIDNFHASSMPCGKFLMTIGHKWRVICTIEFAYSTCHQDFESLSYLSVIDTSKIDTSVLRPKDNPILNSDHPSALKKHFWEDSDGC